MSMNLNKVVGGAMIAVSVMVIGRSLLHKNGVCDTLKIHQDTEDLIYRATGGCCEERSMIEKYIADDLQRYTTAESSSYDREKVINDSVRRYIAEKKGGQP